MTKVLSGISEKTVQRVMQKYGWQCRVKVKKSKRTGQPAYIAPNLLARDFTATKPLEKLVTDITYLPFGQSIMYLSSILDLFNGEIIAQTIGNTQDTAFFLGTLNQIPNLADGCILHSDQGSVYTSYAYQTIKTFHSSLKSETFYLDNIYRTTNACVMNRNLFSFRSLV